MMYVYIYTLPTPMPPLCRRSPPRLDGAGGEGPRPYWCGRPAP